MSSAGGTLLAAALALAVTGRNASAQSTLPYAARTLSFNGLSTSVHGDIRTVGMGGASTGLADTFIAALDNPAGLAMTVGIGDIHFATDSIQDGNVQHFGSTVTTDSFGLALSLYPWAVSVGYLSPYREEERYALEPLRNVGTAERGHARARSVGGANFRARSILRGRDAHLGAGATFDRSLARAHRRSVRFVVYRRRDDRRDDAAAPTLSLGDEL